MPRGKIKLLIDTDPGIDDAMAIACAFNSDEVDIIGFTTIFGNVQTSTATQNVHTLLRLAGRHEVPVAEGSKLPLSGISKAAAAFVHGEDGFGNINHDIVKGVTLDIQAANFIARAIKDDPGNVVILALGPLTNIALAFQSDSTAAQNLGGLVVLGGAFSVEGNVNPAAEANILGDPEAADYVFGQTDRIKVIGLDVTHKCRIDAAQLTQLKESTGRYGQFLHKAVQFYLQYHRQAYDIDAIFAHDPTAFLAVIVPELFTWADGPVRVACDGLARGTTIRDPGRKHWHLPNAWTDRPKIAVAVDVNVEAAITSMLTRMCA